MFSGEAGARPGYAPFGWLQPQGPEPQLLHVLQPPPLQPQPLHPHGAEQPQLQWEQGGS